MSETEKPMHGSVWFFRGIRVETPRSMTIENWEILRKFVEVMKPDEPDAEMAQEPSEEPRG